MESPILATLSRMFLNMGWLGLERVIRSGTALLVTVWIARTLGPEQFGLLNYAQSLTAALYPLATFGLSGILVRDLAQHPGFRDSLLSAALVIRAVGAVVAMVVASLLAWLLTPDNSQTLLLVWILAISYPALVADAIESDYQVRLQNDVLVAIKTLIFVVTTAAKIILVIKGLGVLWLAVVMTVECWLIALWVWAIATYQGHGFVFRCDPRVLRRFLREGWIFLWVGLITAAYQRLDQLLLGYLGGIEELGIYAGAWKILEALAFGPTLVMTVLAPVLAAAYRESKAAFNARLCVATRWLFWTMVGLTGLAMPLVEWLVPLAFGDSYGPAVQIFEIIGWSLPVLALNALSTQWALNVRQLGYLVERGLAGLIVCLGLGLLLIPDHGFIGAAVSLLVSQLFAALLYGWFRPVGREMMVLQTRAIFLGCR